MCFCILFVCERWKKSELKRVEEAICLRSLITRRVNQACSPSATELRETLGDNQKEKRRRRQAERERKGDLFKSC